MYHIESSPFYVDLIHNTTCSTKEEGTDGLTEDRRTDYRMAPKLLIYM